VSDDILRLRERLIREGSATPAEVDAWDPALVRVGLWSAELVGRQVGRVVERSPGHIADASLVAEDLRRLVRETGRKKHWCKVATPSARGTFSSVRVDGPSAAAVTKGLAAHVNVARRVMVSFTDDVSGILTLIDGDEHANGPVIWQWSFPASRVVDIVQLEVKGTAGKSMTLHANVRRSTQVSLSLQSYLSPERPLLVVAALEPDQVALAVIPGPLRTLPHVAVAEGRPAWELPSGRGILLDPWTGGWHPSLVEWIDREGDWKVVAPRDVAEEWARSSARSSTPSP
jgi:hypothetical protein